MEEYFSDDELPSIRQITRDDFASDEFDVERFLTSIHKFQTLDDLRSQLKKWDKTLGRELLDVVNDDYNDFIGLGKSLSHGNEVVENVKTELSKFQRPLSKIGMNLNQSATECENLLSQYDKLTDLENQARALLWLSKSIGDLEEIIDCKEEISMNALSHGVQTFLAIGKLLQKHEDHVTHVHLKSRYLHVGGRLSELIEKTWKDEMARSEKDNGHKFHLFKLHRKVKAIEMSYT